MRILLAQNSLYYPAHGGGDKSNRLLMEALAGRGHICRAVARIPAFGEAEEARYVADLAARGVTPYTVERGVVAFRRADVYVHVVTGGGLRAYFEGQIGAFRPDVILASTDDPAQALLAAALEDPVARVVYLARATLALPFGPDCAIPSAAATRRLRSADRVVGVSEYVARYMREHGDIGAIHVPISLLEEGERTSLGRFDNEFIAMVNPCAVKGIAIFLALAEAFPEAPFAAVPSWGTNPRDRAALAARPNVSVLSAVDDIGELLARTRVLLVPSLWAEARSRVVLEAMLRGVPVMASDVGGIPEAKMGVPYLLPVNRITRYQLRLDEQMTPVAEVPPQDIAPWRAALTGLLYDRAHYEEISAASREAALDYAANLGVEPFEALLEETVRRPKRQWSGASEPSSESRRAGTAGGGTGGEAQRRQTGRSAPLAENGQAGRPAPPGLEELSPERRRLFALRLRKRAPASVWFPGLEAARGIRLFCFPHAGGGAGAFAGWRHAAGIAVCPVRLPGRESRSAEAPFERMAPLVEALAAAMESNLDGPFAFFGHSMGAVVAFEAARRLRRLGLPQPKLLVASGARAPQFRRGYSPPAAPTEARFLEELRSLEGLPAEALDDPALLRAVMPALTADAALFRGYVYAEEEPLSFPIRAYGGRGDPNVKPEHLQGWAEQTISSFAVRLFPGGHFFLNAERTEVLAALAADLEEAC